MAHYTLKPWSECSVLIVNDDGINADGIGVLESLAKIIFREVMVVAPSHEHSGMGHAISYNKTFMLHKIDATHHAVDGTPADCTIVALNHVLKDNLPDIVLSGINHGDNAGNAITYSGTFGGAFEAGLAGIPAVSFSQLRQKDRSVDFAVAQKYFTQVMNFLQTAHWPDHVVMNVNFPPFDNHQIEMPHRVASKIHHIVAGVTADALNDTQHTLTICMKNDTAGHGHKAQGEQNHDLDILAHGGVTITPISTNWTCFETLKKWEH